MSEDTKTELIEDVLGDFGFRVKLKYESHWADVEVWRIVGRGCHDNTPVFNDGESSHEKADRYLSGFIKWDGCSEFDFSPDKKFGHDFHWCGPDDYRQHFALLEYLYRRAQGLMTSGDWEPWDPEGAQ